MSYAVISDVHGNLEAFEAVLRDIDRRTVGTVHFAGDVVGYGADPGACIGLVRQVSRELVAGNHDWAAVGLAPIHHFNPSARAAILWTRDRLPHDAMEFLKSLALTAVLPGENAFLVHASPRDPAAWNYLFTLTDIEKAFALFHEGICFVGHSHQPLVAELHPSGDLELYKKGVRRVAGVRYLVNAGSVGQPRDGDPRASYVIVTDEAIEIVRVPYDIAAAQAKMTKAGLPSLLIERLSRGM